MGNAFGYMPNNAINLYFHPDVTPSPLKEPSFDSDLGFSNGRKERVMKATQEEMVSAKLPLQDRDYCADMLLKFRGCRREKFPFVVRCQHEKHEYLQCQYEDYILRMKEYERERRLMVRAKKLAQAAA